MPSRKLLSPIHPGEILLEEFMRPLDLSANALALALHVDAPRVHEIVHGKRAITADTAMRLARYFGTSVDIWMNLQKDFEIEATRHKQRRIDAQVKPRKIAV